MGEKIPLQVTEGGHGGKQGKRNFSQQIAGVGRGYQEIV